MAIDTAAKRKSIVGIDRISGPGVTPDATPDEAWRVAVGYSYSGILPVIPELPDFWNAMTGMPGLTSGGDIEDI